MIRNLGAIFVSAYIQIIPSTEIKGSGKQLNFPVMEVFFEISEITTIIPADNRSFTMYQTMTIKIKLKLDDDSSAKTKKFKIRF